MRIKTKEELLATGWVYNKEDDSYDHENSPYYLKPKILGQKVREFNGYGSPSWLVEKSVTDTYDGKWFLTKEAVSFKESNIIKLLKSIDTHSSSK